MTIIFLHVPKAAGTSMLGVLSQQYGPHNTVPGWDQGVWSLTDIGIHKLLTCDGNEPLDNIPCVHGHIQYGVHVCFTDAQYITMLRHPVERIVSFYHYIDHLTGFGRDWWADHGVFYGIPLSDFIHLPLLHFNNSMTRQMLGIQFRHQSTKENVGLSPSLYRKAIENLKGFAAIGITAHFNDSIQLFGRKLGWTKPSTPVHELKLDYPQLSNPELRRQIEEHNRYDMDLYKWALKNFKEKISEERD